MDYADQVYFAAVILANYHTLEVRAAGEELACGYGFKSGVACTDYVLSLAP